MKIVDTSDPKSREYLTKIGEIVVTLNHLESLLELAIWELINMGGNAVTIQSIGRRITYELEFMEKANLLRSLIVERYGENIAKDFVETIYKNLTKCSEIRNDVAHSLWFIQYGNNKEDLETVKINIKHAFERGKSFDFSKARKKLSLRNFKLMCN